MKLSVPSAVLCILGGLSWAQAPSDEGRLVQVIQIHVKPAMAAQYEEARKDIVAELATHGASHSFTESRGGRPGLPAHLSPGELRGLGQEIRRNGQD